MAFDLSSVTSLLRREIKKPADTDTVLGVDIGSSAIKIVQLKDVKGIPTLDTYGELQLGPYEGVDIGRGTHLTSNKLVEALIDILREAGATGKRVAYAFSYNSSFTNVISVPTLDEARIDAMIPVEARKYIPLALSRVTLDWISLGMNEKEKATKVLLSAIYNDAISKYEAVMSSAGLTTLASEIEIFSSIRSIVSPQDERVAVLDCGASSTRLYIIEKGVVRKTHSVLLSGVELTSALAKTLGSDFMHAEEIKRTYGLSGKEDDPRIQQTLLTTLERGLRELHTVISRYEQDEGVQLQKVVLSGGGSLLVGLPAYLQDMFSKPTEYANPFTKVAYPAFLEDTLESAGPSFAVAVGAGIRGIQSLK